MSLAAAALTGCMEEPPRPGPPQITITLERTTVRSRIPPDTLVGTVRAVDPDGLDSVWVSVDSVVAGEDGRFAQSFTSRFAFLIGQGKTPGTRIPVEVRARDIAGFQVTRDTQVVVVP